MGDGRKAYRAILRILARQHQVITRAQALEAGLSPTQVATLVRNGRWIRVHAGVYRSAEAPRTVRGDVMAACLATTGWASHESAGGLWDLVDPPPRAPVVTVQEGLRRTRPGITVHRTTRQDRVIATLHHIPCTGPLDTVLDLAATVRSPVLDLAIDRAVARQLVAVEELLRSLHHPSQVGRRGRRMLLRSLAAHGYSGAPNPSVLESQVLRLLLDAGIRPRARERTVTWSGGRYRLDFDLTDEVALEVDGFAHHGGREAWRHDHRRRNRIAGTGKTVLVFTWMDVAYDGERVVDEVRRAMSAHGRLVG